MNPGYFADSMIHFLKIFWPLFGCSIFGVLNKNDRIFHEILCVLFNIFVIFKLQLSLQKHKKDWVFTKIYYFFDEFCGDLNRLFLCFFCSKHAQTSSVLAEKQNGLMDIIVIF